MLSCIEMLKYIPLASKSHSRGPNHATKKSYKYQEKPHSTFSSQDIRTRTSSYRERTSSLLYPISKSTLP